VAGADEGSTTMITLATTQCGRLPATVDELVRRRLDRVREEQNLPETSHRVEETPPWDAAIDRWVNEGGATITPGGGG
jgi:hypothetical protein